MQNLSSKFTLSVLGRSGSGKGVQAHMLLSLLGKRAHHMETGRFLRELTSGRLNSTTHIIHTLLKKGRLHPWWVPVFTWLREMIEGGVMDKHLVFDGAPRRVEEAKLLDEVLAWHGRPKALCIY